MLPTHTGSLHLSVLQGRAHALWLLPQQPLITAYQSQRTKACARTDAPKNARPTATIPPRQTGFQSLRVSSRRRLRVALSAERVGSIQRKRNLQPRSSPFTDWAGLLPKEMFLVSDLLLRFGVGSRVGSTVSPGCTLSPQDPQQRRKSSCLSRN